MNAINKLSQTVKLRLFGHLKIPMLGWLRPVVEYIDDDRCVVRFPLTRRSKNHLGSMYFGALCAGADTAGGLIAMDLIQRHHRDVAFVFKDFDAKFLKRAHGDVLFTCDEGQKVRHLVAQAAASGERVEDTVHITATCPSKLGDEPVAQFALTISLRRKR